MNKLIIVFILSLLSFSISGQGLGDIVSPLHGDTVVNGQILIVFRLNPDLKIKPSSLDIFIDRTSYKYLMKVNGNKISVLVTTQIKEGPKSIRIKAKDHTNQKFEKNWGFLLISDKIIPIIEKKTTSVKASIETDSRFSEITGDGAALRQEPPVTHQLRFRGNIRHGKIEIPMKLYLTNHEKSYLQPRDRFLIGIKSEKVGICFGDINPYYHKLILNGTRIRGAETYLQFRTVRLSLLYGVVNRPVEGLRLYYNSLEDASFPPVNLQDISYDTTQIGIRGFYNENGTYRRNLMAAKVTVGSPNTFNKIHFAISRSTDDTTSISYGGQASQNFTFGVDFESKSKNRRLILNTGIAVAFTTRDIHYGVASKETIDTLYGIELPVDPYKFRNLLVFNSTSTMPTYKYSSFLSYYIKPEYRIANQIITAEVRRIGSDFQSFGNPYLINDRFIVSLADRMRFINNRLLIQLRFRHFNNNLTKNDTVTYNTDMVDASFNYLIKNNLPRLTGGFRRYFRTGKHIDTKEKYREYQISNYYAGIIINSNIFESNSSVTLNYNLNQRNYLKRQQTVSSHSIYINLNQDYGFGLTVNLQYNFMLLSNDTSDFGKNNTYGARFGYHTKNNKLRFSLGAMRVHSIKTVWFPESERSSISAIFSYEILKDFTIKLEGGKSEYIESGNTNRDYNELYGQIGLRYRFTK